MNTDQITSIIRQILLAVGGFFVGKGYVDSETMAQIAGASTIIIGSIWALWSRTDKNVVASAAAKVPVSDTAQRSVGISDPVSPK
jgi:multisubunit Na+/H+ antiporter MnhG subunit